MANSRRLNCIKHDSFCFSSLTSLKPLRVLIFLHFASHFQIWRLPHPELSLLTFPHSRSPVVDHILIYHPLFELAVFSFKLNGTKRGAASVRPARSCRIRTPVIRRHCSGCCNFRLGSQVRIRESLDIFLV